MPEYQERVKHYFKVFFKAFVFFAMEVNIVLLWKHIDFAASLCYAVSVGGINDLH
jgi:hypothetical protein